jgi:hypothetical protein
MRSSRTWLTVVLAGVLAAGARPAAIERMRLPPFQLTAPGGAVVTTDQLVRPGKWLMIYVPPACGRCEALLRLVVKAEHPLVPSRLVILVGSATADSVQAAAAQFPDLAESAWFADPSGASVVPLRLGTTVAVFGMNGNMIEWSLSGVLSPSPEMQSVLTNWVQ